MNYSIPADELARQGNIFPAAVRGRTVWVKKRRRRENLLFWFMQKALYSVTRLTLLTPPELPPPGTGSVEFETERLRRAAELGLRTPEVLHREEGYFVLEDAGTPLEQHIRTHPDEKEDVIRKAAAELRRMHGLGLAHGGAQIKNITVRDGEIFFIDLEERIPEKRLEDFMLRDVFLFLFSLQKAGHDPDLRRIVGAYCGDAGAEAERVLRRLAAALRQLRALNVLTSRVFAKWSLRDVRAICALVKKSETA